MATAVPPSISESSQGRPPESPWLRQQRHTMINALLVMVLVVAAPAIVYSAVITLRRGSLSFNGAYYFAAYLLFTFLLLARRIPDAKRVVITLAAMYGFALLALYTGWLGSSGRGFLLGLILVSGLLVRLRVSYLVAALALLTFLVFGWAYASGALVLPAVAHDDPAVIIIETFGFALAIGIVLLTEVFLWRAIVAANRAEQEARQAQQLLDQRARQLETNNEQLARLGGVKDEFVSNISHELRTPITSILLHLDLVSIHPDKREMYLATVRRETERLAHIIEGLLMLSRLDQSRLDYRPVPINLNSVASLYLADRQAIAASRQIELGVEAESGLPLVDADEGLLGQALGILMTNAINYTPPGGKVTLLTRSQRSEAHRWATLSVRDSGPGIPAEELPHLFERFFRGTLGRASGTPGTGLGLSIAREIVTRHNGRLELSQNSPQGAEFTIWIPAIEPAAGGPALPLG